jgi:hypothetical protein
MADRPLTIFIWLPWNCARSPGTVLLDNIGLVRARRVGEGGRGRHARETRTDTRERGEGRSRGFIRGRRRQPLELEVDGDRGDDLAVRICAPRS